MTDYQTLLELESSQETLLLLKNYIDTTTLTVNQYQTVFIRMLEVMYDLEMFHDVYHEGLSYHQSILHIDVMITHEKLFELIILSALKLKQFDSAYTYIQNRKQVLPISKKYLADLDLIEFKKQTHQSYIEDIESVLKDAIPDDLKLNLLKELLMLYLNKKEDHKALNVIDQLKRLDTKHTYVPEYLKILYNLEHFDDAKIIALNYRNHQLYEMDSFLTLLKIYIKENDQHKISILDADYGIKLETQSVEIQKEAYTLFSDYYQKIKNRYQYDSYSKKLKALIKDEKKSKDKTIEKTVLRNDLEEQTQTEKPQFVQKMFKAKENIRHLNILIELFSFAHQIAETKNFRDYLRNFFIKVDEYVKVKDYIIFTSKDEMLYHYKKERLYDKQLVASTYLNTLVGEVLKDGEERFGNPKSFKYDKNVLTNQPFDESISYIYAYSLFDQGVLMIYLEEEISDPALYFDLFKGLSAILYGSLMDEEKRVKLRLSNDFLNQIINSPIMQIRIYSEYQSIYNIAAQKLFDLESFAPYEVFLGNLNAFEANDYRKIIERLMTKSGLVDTFTYVYQDKQIREKMVSVLDGKDIKMISIFEDITNYYEEKSRLLMDATVDFETSLENLNALSQKLPQYVLDKGAFFLINFNENILPIYGYDVSLKFFKEFGQLTKKFFNEGDTYRFSTYQLFVYIPINDIRAVTKMIKEYLRYLDSYQSSVISYEKFHPLLSVIRYPVVTEEKIPAKLFRYLELSIDYLKRQNTDDQYIFFEHKIYEDEVFEQQVINYLNQAMNDNQLSLSFDQIIDVTRGVVWQYESELILEHMQIDSKYLLAIAKKRNRLMDLEKFHIEMVCQFLNTLEKETKKLVKITIPVSKETFLDVSFNPYIFGLFQKYEIPFEFVRFKIKGDHLKSNQYITQIDELSKSGVGLDTTSVDVALSYPFNALHIDYKTSDQKYNDYIKLLKQLFDNHGIALVIRDVRTKGQADMLVELGIKYIEGSIYKKITADLLFLKISGKNP